MRQEILNLGRGADGVGSATINRNFIRKFGLDAAFVLSDAMRAYVWCHSSNTLEGDFFYWNENNICNNLQYPLDKVEAALRILMKNNLLKAARNSENELMFALNLDELKKHGQMQLNL